MPSAYPIANLTPTELQVLLRYRRQDAQDYFKSAQEFMNHYINYKEPEYLERAQTYFNCALRNIQALHYLNHFIEIGS